MPKTIKGVLNWLLEQITSSQNMLLEVSSFNQNLSGWDVKRMLKSGYENFDKWASSWTLPKSKI